jgi:hypothetical protein
LQRIPNALLIPRASIGRSEKEDYVLADDGGAYSRKPIRLEAENDIDAAVSGIGEGTRVLDSVSQ